jgi:hypothetical protein
MFRALFPPIFRSTRLCVTACGIMRSFQATGIPATSWVHYTTSCNTQSSSPEDGQNNCPKPVELTGIINKLLLLNLVGVYIIYINDTWSNNYQIHMIVVCVFMKNNCVCLRLFLHFIFIFVPWVTKFKFFVPWISRNLSDRGVFWEVWSVWTPWGTLYNIQSERCLSKKARFIHLKCASLLHISGRGRLFYFCGHT